MSLDTKNRPLIFDDVLGQDATIRVLRRFIATGRGFQQSYLFAGPFGSGKTTLGRILARGLLCGQPTSNGDPCDSCPSCRSILDLGTSMDFVEVDAATNSGKAEIQKIVDEIQYDTFSGRRRIFLFDESHQLSTSALDALLKPLEENAAGSTDKRLVCIFCTTEPEKMRATILSRCAPAFIIHPVAPAVIADRLALICTKEGISYDLDMLAVIAEMTECHIRDAIKAIEGVSMLGPVNKDNVVAYLRLDLNAAYLDILEFLGQDLGVAMASARKILERASPASCYERLADMAMTIYQVFIGVSRAPAYMDKTRIESIGRVQQHNLLGFASRFASRPGRPTEAMLLCDLGSMHYAGGQIQGHTTIVVSPTPIPANGVPNVAGIAAESPKNSDTSAGSIQYSGPATVQPDRRAIKNRSGAITTASPRVAGSSELDLEEFCRLLGMHVRELDQIDGGPTRRIDVGSPRTDSPG